MSEQETQALAVPKIVEQFLEHLDAERNFSPHTIRSYGGDLVQFCRFLSDPANQGADPPGDSAGEADNSTPSRETLTERIIAVSPLEIRSYLAAMRSRDYSKASIARKLATLRSFYKFLVRMERIESSPVSVVRTPRQNKRLPKCLDIQQVSALLATPDTTTLLGARDKAILEVHLFDFDGDIYGQSIDVIFRHKIRDERKFESLGELEKNIRADINASRRWFSLD